MLLKIFKFFLNNFNFNQHNKNSNYIASRERGMGTLDCKVFLYPTYNFQRVGYKVLLAPKGLMDGLTKSFRN